MAMTATAFDTLSYARRLKEAGVDEAQAEVHAEAVRDAVTEGVATKADLKSAVADLKAEIAPLKAEIVSLKADLRAVRWMLGLILSVLGIVAAFVIAVGVHVFGAV